MAKKGGAGDSSGNGAAATGGGKSGGGKAGSEKPGRGAPPSTIEDLDLSGIADDAELEAVSQELERGWQHIENGEIAEARSVANRLLGQYPETPEVLVLLGMVESLEGKPDLALQHYEQASDGDPEYVEPLLCAAELYIWELGEDEKGLELCQRAKEVAEEEDEYLDALLLQAEAEINLGRERAALTTLREIPEVDLPETRYHVRAGRLLLDLQRIDEAERQFKRAYEKEANNVDALHGLGLCAEHRSQRPRMIEYFQKVRTLDLKEARPPWALSEAAFRKLCATALDELPEDLRRRMQNVPIVASDYPSEDMVKDGSDPRMLGFFAGVPFGEHSQVGGTPHLEAIFLFQRNIERIAYGPEDVEQEVRVTLVHEAGHFFGLSEEQLEAMGLG
ncbi:MAG: tetratricopeptide repeat protein [Elusimicrobia bacterium]|nr:MAG: tetratricopeptide repeat protein [Elusimicrobiota bacterium]